jgi:hypothetical protein
VVIGSLLESKDYEQAFVEGLRAQSLEIMIWLLEQLEPTEVLETLTQVVLISLIQQLGVQLPSDDTLVRPHPSHRPAIIPPPSARPLALFRCIDPTVLGLCCRTSS